MNRIFLCAAMLLSVLAACTVEETLDYGKNGMETEVIPVTEDVVKGELFVRFDPRVSSILEESGVVTKSGNAALTRSGVLSVDEILDLVDGYRIERVFPRDARSEEDVRAEGMDLWYVVKFSEEHPVDEVAARLSKLGEVSRVSYNRVVRKATASAVPLAKEMVETLADAAGSFNDPLLKYQWHLVNNGSNQQVPVAKPSKSQAGFLLGADVNVKSAWDKCMGHPSIIVAVLDEGIDFNHPDLKGSMWINEGEVWRSDKDNDGNGYVGDYYGYNFATGSGVISTGGRYDTGHGSHVAGVIAATNNNGQGISSIAGGTETEPGVRLMSCQLFSGSRGCTLLDEVRAIKYAADNGAVILQCSWGYISGAANPFDWTPQYANDEEWILYNELEKTALDYFVHYAGSPDGVIEGGVVVFAAGNESAPAASYPAAYSDYISVAAIAPDYTPAVYTNYGMGTTISAPGGDQDYYYAYGDEFKAGQAGCVLSTLPFNVTGTTDKEFSGYGYMEGTSMACPHVSGVVALGMSYAAKNQKHFKATEIKELLYKSVKPFETYWSLMSGFPDKNYYKYVADQQQVHFTGVDLNIYRGKMGHGLVDAAAFLNAIATGGVAMTFPNVYVQVGDVKTYDPSLYLAGSSYVLTVEDSSVATVEYKDGKIYVKGVRTGQTVAKIKGDSEQVFVITVRETAGTNGWL